MPQSKIPMYSEDKHKPMISVYLVAGIGITIIFAAITYFFSTIEMLIYITVAGIAITILIDVACDLNKLPDAIQSLDKTINENFKVVDAKYMMGDIHSNLGKQYAVQIFDKFKIDMENCSNGFIVYSKSEGTQKEFEVLRNATTCIWAVHIGFAEDYLGWLKGNTSKRLRTAYNQSECKDKRRIILIDKEKLQDITYYTLLHEICDLQKEDNFEVKLYEHNSFNNPEDQIVCDGQLITVQRRENNRIPTMRFDFDEQVVSNFLKNFDRYWKKAMPYSEYLELYNINHEKHRETDS